MRHDNVVSAQMPGFGELEISPHTVEEIISLLLRNGRACGKGRTRATPVWHG